MRVPLYLPILIPPREKLSLSLSLSPSVLPVRSLTRSRMQRRNFVRSKRRVSHAENNRVDVSNTCRLWLRAIAVSYRWCRLACSLRRDVCFAGIYPGSKRYFRPFERAVYKRLETFPDSLYSYSSSILQHPEWPARSSKSHARDSSLALSGFSKLFTRHCLRNFNSEISVPLSLSLSLCVNTLVGSAKASEYSEAEAGLNVSSKLNKNNSRSGRIGATITSRACLSAKPVHDTIPFLSQRSVHRSGSSTLLAARGEYARGRPSGFNLDRRAVTGAVE